MAMTYPPELEQFVQQELANGRYHNEDELLLAALTLYRDMKQRHDDLCLHVQRSIEQADRGEVEPWDIDAILAEAHRRHAERK